MRWRRPPTRRSVRAGLRALLAGTLFLGSVGSCELPKPKIPSIGAAPASPAAARQAPVPRADPRLAVAALSVPAGEPF